MNPAWCARSSGVESDFDHWAISSKGAHGLMQLMPDTARRMGVLDSFDPRQNIFGGARFLRILLDKFRGDIALAVAAYNAGENAVTRYGGIPPYKETRSYVGEGADAAGPGQPHLRPARGHHLRQLLRAPNPGALQPGAFAARSPARAANGAARRAAFVPLRPRVYYKWADGQGVVHLTQAPPGDGVVYSMIRALD